MEDKVIRAKRRKLRVRGRLGEKDYRLSVFRSNRYLFAQIIDQKSGKTILGLSDKSLSLEKGKTKTQRAKEFGVKFAQEALKKKIKEIVFDRGPYQYHGRVRAFAEGLRSGGLKF